MKPLLITIVVVFVLLILYWLLVEPSLAMFVFPKTVHEGTEYYESNAYLQCEDGKVFWEFLSGLELPDSKSAVFFYHIDNRVMDNPLYGKMSDVFTVDFRVSDSQYAEIKEQYTSGGVSGTETEDFMLYVCDFGGREDVKTALAFNDAHGIIRCIMVTYREGTVSGYDIYKTLYLRTDIPFSATYHPAF